MGSSISTSVNVASQVTVNEIFQESSTTCFASCRQNVDNVNLIVKDNSRIGDVIITQKCQANSTCTIKTELDSISLQELEAYQFADSNAQPHSWFTWPGFAISTSANISSQALSNSITQVINNVCQADIQQSTSNVNVYVSNNSEVGAINITQEGEATADCVVENTAKAKATQTARTEQISQAKTGSTFVLILSILAIIILVIGVLFLKNRSQAQKLETRKEVILGGLEKGYKSEEIARLVAYGGV